MKIQTKALTVLVAERTEKGLREENQDAMTKFPSSFGTVYLVADGMGGTQGGATASLMTAECYKKYLTSLASTLSLEEALQRATSATNAEIRLRSKSGDPSLAGMGSTVVMAILTPGQGGFRGTLAHVGDSRAYVFRRGALQQLTRDHSAVQRLVDSGAITAEEARNHPDSNVIVRALGPNEEVQIDVVSQMFEPGDLLLLCSDGLCGSVNDADIAARLSGSEDLSQKAEALIALALKSGSSDNITVQLLHISEQEGIPRSTMARFGHTIRPQAVEEGGLAGDSERRGRFLALLRNFGMLLTGLLFGTGLTFFYFDHVRSRKSATTVITKPEPAVGSGSAPVQAPPPPKPGSPASTPANNVHHAVPEQRNPATIPHTPVVAETDRRPAGSTPTLPAETKQTATPAVVPAPSPTKSTDSIKEGSQPKTDTKPTEAKPSPNPDDN